MKDSKEDIEPEGLKHALAAQRLPKDDGQWLYIVPVTPEEDDVLGDWDEHNRRFGEGQPPTEGELREWWSKWPDARVGLHCGSVVFTQHCTLMDARGDDAQVALRLGATRGPGGKVVRVPHEIADKLGELTRLPRPDEPMPPTH